jgi:hypothetical protein
MDKRIGDLSPGLMKVSPDGLAGDTEPDCCLFLLKSLDVDEPDQLDLLRPERYPRPFHLMTAGPVAPAFGREGHRALYPGSSPPGASVTCRFFFCHGLFLKESCSRKAITCLFHYCRFRMSRESSRKKSMVQWHRGPWPQGRCFSSGTFPDPQQQELPNFLGDVQLSRWLPVPGVCSCVSPQAQVCWVVVSSSPVSERPEDFCWLSSGMV